MIKILLTAIVIFTSPKLVQTDDLSMIAYFEGNCPEGWKSYDRLGGKFALGSNEKYVVGQIGGEEEHTLTVDEMPEHNHQYRIPSHPFTHLAQAGGTVPHWNTALFSTTFAGKNHSHNNMPPYLVLTACKKVQDDVTLLKAKIDDMNRVITELQSKLLTMEKSTLIFTLSSIVHEVPTYSISVFITGLLTGAVSIFCLSNTCRRQNGRRQNEGMHSQQF